MRLARLLLILGIVAVAYLFDLLEGLERGMMAWRGFAPGAPGESLPAMARLPPGLVLTATALILAFAQMPFRRRPWPIALLIAGTTMAAAVLASFGVQAASGIYVDVMPAILAATLDFTTRLALRLRRQGLWPLISSVTLGRQNAFMREVVENSLDAIFTLSMDGRLLSYNPAARKLFGYASDQVIGRHIGKLLAEASIAGENGGLARLPTLRGTHEVTCSRLDGEVLVLDLAISQIKSGDDLVSICLARDITEKRRAEEHARQAQDRLMESIESIREGIALFDRDDRLVAANRRFREKGRPAEASSIGLPLYREIIEPLARSGYFVDAAANPDKWIADRLAYHTRPSGTLEERTSDGRWILTSERRTETGGTVVVETDITELKRREEQLLTLTRKLSQMGAGMNSATSGILLTDAKAPGHPVLFVNPAFTEITGYSQEEVRRLKRGFLRGPETSLETAQAMYDALDRGERYQGTILHYRKDGTPYWDEVRVAPVPDDDGVVAYNVWILNDVTGQVEVKDALVRAKEEAEAANRIKSEFLAAMSHELRTPLNAIIGFSEMMVSRVYGPLGSDNYAGYAADIHTSGKHLLGIINGILDMAKIEAGQFKPQDEIMDLTKEIGVTLSIVRERAAQKEIALSSELGEAPVHLLADSRIVRQIILNLLSNAIKFTPEGGRVTVRAGAAEAGGVAVVVEDTGIGMSAEDLVKAMEPFGQVQSSLAREYDGTGLGLPLVKRFIELHGGRLDIDTACGAGTRARIVFPAERVLSLEDPETEVRAEAGKATGVA